MDLNTEQPKIINEKYKTDFIPTKRKFEEELDSEPYKKLKIEGEKLVDIGIEENEEPINQQNNNCNKTQITKDVKEVNETKSNHTKCETSKQKRETPTKVPSSPKKRLDVTKTPPKANKEKFIYGNYSQYYGYRNKDKDFHDIRLDVFKEHLEIFRNKQILDIGCNSGFITMEVAKQLECKSIVGLDIDKSLINQAIKNLTRCKKSLPMDNELKRLHKFPFNISFVHGNYVLKDDVLLDIERPQFDVILCLSITKWIHLNFGDNGLKQAFKRMFLQLRPRGKLILEAQPFDNYGRRKKMTVS